MRIFTIIGARPQFIKCAPVSKMLRREHNEFIVHTGQHYDENMSHIFFDEMGIPKPDVNLEVGSGSHAVQTAAMMTGLEPLMIEHVPDVVIVYGDTNSTLAGALVAAKLHIPVVHIEAGLRSFNTKMPEEINRIVSDKLASLLCCPTETAVQNLKSEGITNGVINTGDVMYDALLHFLPLSQKSPVLTTLKAQPKEYSVLTLHRASNTDDKDNLMAILEGVNVSEKPVYFPVHPRTRSKIHAYGLDTEAFNTIRFIEPLGYLDFMALASQAERIITDSGGLQKEAYWHGIPCITVRTETEWVETVDAGWNCITGADTDAIQTALATFHPTAPRPDLYGTGNAAQKTCDALSHINEILNYE